MDYAIVNATEEDREELLSLYKAQIGRECCPWDEEYPGEESIDWDLSRNALYVMKAEGKILAAISFEEDEDVAAFPFWDKDLEPSAELARLAVLPEWQNRGLAKAMLRFGMEELKRRGFCSVRFMVNETNAKAIRSYASFGFHVAGKCHIYEQDMFCYEKKL